MKNQIFSNKRPIFILTLCLTFLFWLFFLSQTITTQFTVTTPKAIPAFLNTDNICPADIKSLSEEVEFLNKTTARIPLSHISNKPNSTWSETQMLSFLQKYDKQIYLVSFHKEKNYTDYYFYIPKINRNSLTASTENFNLQTAITHNYVYFGIPLIDYDF